MEQVLIVALYLLLGVGTIYFYDATAYRNLRKRLTGSMIRMSVNDWDKVYDCTYLMKVDSQALAIIFLIAALILWPVTLIIMEVKRHIAYRILKKYRRDK